jgi:hypothetical protein
MTTTPDIEEDVLQRLAALAPSVLDVAGSDRNAWSGPLRPSVASGVPQKAFFVQHSAGGLTSIHNDGRLRSHEIIVTCRSNPQDYTGVMTAARAIYDAADLSGGFTGTSGKVYYEMRAVGSAPAYEGTDGSAEYFSVVLEVMTDG